MSAAINSNQTLTQRLAKRFNLGLGLWKIRHDAKVFQRRCVSEGPLNMWLAAQGRQQMEQAAYALTPLNVDESSEPLPIHFLTGRKHWYQTLFCAYSMILHGQINLSPVIFDDGTLTEPLTDAMRRIIPATKIMSPKEVNERLDNYLPASKFPFFRSYRNQDVLLRKLTDVHATAPGWKLYLDSDMLFFHRPAFLIEWLKSPQQPCYMEDVRESYSYTEALRLSLTKAPLPEKLNSGLNGLNREDIDWEQAESWWKTLVEKEGHQYFTEQTMTAMLLAGRACAVAPREDYIVWPKRGEVMNPQAVMHHYVGETRAWYFRYGWKLIARHHQQH